MEKFRICENKYGWFKIQLWYPPKKILFIKLKGKWKDSCFRLNSTKCRKFETLEGAQEAMKGMIENCERLNNEWQC